MIHFDVFRSKIIEFKVRSAEAEIVSVSHREPWSHVHWDWSILCRSDASGTKFAVSDVNGPCWHSTFILVVRSTLRSRAKIWKVRRADRDWKFGAVLLISDAFRLVDLHTKLNPRSQYWWEYSVLIWASDLCQEQSSLKGKVGCWSVMESHRDQFLTIFGKSSKSIPGENLSIRIEFSVEEWFISTYSDQKLSNLKWDLPKLKLSVCPIVNHGVMFTETGQFCAEVTPQGLNSLFQTWMVLADTLLSF